MGIRTISGTADGTRHAAAMYDSVTGRMLGVLFEHDSAEEQIDGFLTWMQHYNFVAACEQAGLEPADVPPPTIDIPTDPREWPESGLRKLITYYLRTEWPA